MNGDIGITKEEAYAFVRTHRGEDERSDAIVYNYLNKPNNNPPRYYLPGETINDKIMRESIEENENAKKIGELVKEADRDKELFLAGKKKLDYYIYIPEDQLGGKNKK